MKVGFIDLVNLFGETANENGDWFGKDSENACIMIAETADPDAPEQTERRRLAAFTAGRGDKIVSILTRAMLSNDDFKQLMFATVHDYEENRKLLEEGITSVEDRSGHSHRLKFDD